jgi:hypothetical protein
MDVTRIFPLSDRMLVIVQLATFDWDFTLGRPVRLIQGSNSIEAKQIGSGNYEGYATIMLAMAGAWDEMMAALRKMEASGETISIELC